MAGVEGFEPTKCWSQSPVPYRLAIPHRVVISHNLRRILYHAADGLSIPKFNFFKSFFSARPPQTKSPAAAPPSPRRIARRPFPPEITSLRIPVSTDTFPLFFQRVLHSFSTSVGKEQRKLGKTKNVPSLAHTFKQQKTPEKHKICASVTPLNTISRCTSSRPLILRQSSLFPF